MRATRGGGSKLSPDALPGGSEEPKIEPADAPPKIDELAGVALFRHLRQVEHMELFKQKGVSNAIFRLVFGMLLACSMVLGCSSIFGLSCSDHES